MKLYTPDMFLLKFSPLARACGVKGRELLLCMVIIAVSGCTMIPGSTPRPVEVDGTAVALQLTRMASEAIQPTQTALIITPEPLPTYTPQPTYTLAPTWTPLPTYTSYPTYTPPLPEPVLLPSQTSPAVAPGVPRPFTLRVRNLHRTTMWIGAKMPYGGNFIKRLWYVEFYPPQETWLRVWVCQYTRYFYEHWDDSEWTYYSDYWNLPEHWKWDHQDFWIEHKHLNNCYFRDYYVDETLIEVSVP